MSPIETAADRARPAVPGEPAGAVHQAVLERVLGRIFSVFAALILAAFWLSSVTLGGQQPGSVAADLLLSTLLIWQVLQALHQPPSRRDLYLLAATTAALLLASRALATSRSPFLDDAAYALVTPVAVAWGVWSARFVVAVPVLLVVLTTGVLNPGGDLPIEQAAGVLAFVACTSCAARFLRAGARQTDDDNSALSRRMAAQDAALAAEEAERGAANVLHDDVLSVLRAASVADLQVPWSVVVANARLAQDSLARQVPLHPSGFADLASKLRRQASQVAAELDVRCDIDGDLDMPVSAAEALTAATGEALRNVVAHAGARSVTLTARSTGPGGVTVSVSDNGVGFDPARVGPASTGLRNSIQARLADASGRAEIISSPGRGTTVVLTWNPPQPTTVPVFDPLSWARRLAPRPQLIFAGFMLPILLYSLIVLCLHWQDMRWPAAAAAVFGGLLGIAVLCARYLSKVQMARSAAVVLTVTNTVLAVMGTLAVAPGTADPYAYGIAAGSGILITVVYLLRGPISGLTTLALDVAALTAGLLVTGRAVSPGDWVSILAGPAVGAGVAAGLLAAFRSLTRYTELQLAENREQLRRQARAEAIRRVDSALVEYARHIARPVLDLIVSTQKPDPAVRMAAALANATLRDELLAPGFLTSALAEQVRAARIAGARVTLDFARGGDAALVEPARQFLAAALSDSGAGDDVTLQVHPSAEAHPALLILHLRGSRPGHAALRRSASEYGALVSELGNRELLVRLQPASEHTEPGSTHRNGEQSLYGNLPNRNLRARSRPGAALQGHRAESTLRRLRPQATP